MQGLSQNLHNGLVGIQCVASSPEHHCVKHRERILAANEKDMARGREKGMKAGLLDRLLLTPERIEGMAEGLRQIGHKAPLFRHNLCRADIEFFKGYFLFYLEFKRQGNGYKSRMFFQKAVIEASSVSYPAALRSRQRFAGNTLRRCA